MNLDESRKKNMVNRSSYEGERASESLDGEKILEIERERRIISD